LRWPIGAASILAGGCSDADCELCERDAQPVVCGFVGGDFVVAAAQVLHESVPFGQGAS
jgi:hypothetical protein